ncbi:MAG: aldo/keto reductase [Magnetococcales bacterium]|nr:aldo/keto reductase [Magnetococcales bacterium]
MEGRAMIYGTAWKKERTAGLVAQALAAGFRAIDTACQPKHYHEAGVGEGVALAMQRGLRRDELYLQTKFTPLAGQDPGRVPYDPHASPEEQVRQSFQVSLQNLRTDYLDCLVLHSPLATVAETMTVWRAMEGLFRQEGVRRLGISNCYDPRLVAYLAEHCATPPAVIQNRFYAATGYDRQIRAFCNQQGISYQSFWTLTANPHLLDHPVVQALARRHQRSGAQILFRYLTQVGVTPLTGTTSPVHMREDLAIREFELTGEECQQVTGLLA